MAARAPASPAAVRVVAVVAAVVVEAAGEAVAEAPVVVWVVASAREPGPRGNCRRPT
ncbi:hypothetical protein [Streptomyces sp. NPDC002215]|uniref:hypothetical protein n=1 Tax=Streptomyces sp. NPDC002215 TaxID=3154412 RepID=UPI003332DE98